MKQKHLGTEPEEKSFTRQEKKVKFDEKVALSSTESKTDIP